MRALFIVVAAFAVYVLAQDIGAAQAPIDAATQVAFGKHPALYLENSK